MQAGEIFTEGRGCWVGAFFIKQPLQLLSTRWIAKCLLPMQYASEGETAPCMSAVLYCKSQLCSALTRLQRKQNPGQRAALLQYSVIMGADRGLFLCCHRLPHAMLCTLAGNHIRLIGWKCIGFVFLCGVMIAITPTILTSEQATIVGHLIKKLKYNMLRLCYYLQLLALISDT